MDKTYSVRIRYSETVAGARRNFTHDVELSASSSEDACASAIDYFKKLARESNVAWPREIEAVTVIRDDKEIDH
jgi:hypothetical protein